VVPNYFLVGTTKGGTSSLDLWLRGHPEVANPKRKELHFFCKCPRRLRAVDTIEGYLAAFPEGRAVGEASPCYLYYPDIPEKLDAFPDTRVVVSLRDPVERYWSHFLMNDAYRPTGLDAFEVLDKNLEDGPTDAVEDLFGVGLYGKQLARYLDIFSPSRMMVLFLEEFGPDPTPHIRRLQEFLGLTPIHLDTSEKDKQHVEPRGRLGRVLLRNPTMRRIGITFLSPEQRRLLKTQVLGDPTAKPVVPVELKARLRSLYRDDSRRLESLLGRDLPWDWHR
jgi:hypothetical protein